MQKDSDAYRQKKQFFNKMLTIYGRNATMEALLDDKIVPYKLHLSSSNKPSKEISRLIELAQNKKIEISSHSKQELSRISKNSKQDQGVALDIKAPNFMTLDEFISLNSRYRIIAIDGVTNPQNLGMIIRSAAAGNIDAILLSTNSTATISSLVIKASAGTLFKIPIIKSKNLASDINSLQDSHDAVSYLLDSHATESYKEVDYAPKSIFILGSESAGVSDAVREVGMHTITIPMNNNVESLNVAVTGALLSFI